MNADKALRLQYFRKYVAMVDAVPCPEEHDHYTIRIWRKYNEWSCHPCGFYDLYDKKYANASEEEKELLRFVNGLIEYGPLNNPESDYVVCRCGRLARLNSHYTCKYHSGYHEWCSGCLHEIENSDDKCEPCSE